MPVRTKDQLKAELSTTFFDNPGGGITPALVQTFMIDVIDSIPDAAGTNFAFTTGVTAGVGTATAASRALGIGIGAAAGSGSASGIVSTLSAEAVQFFDRLITMPSSARQTAYATLIDSLVSASVWAKLDVLCLYAASDPATGFTNLVQEPHRGAVDSSSGVPIFTADQGWSACGAVGNKSPDANFNPSTAGGNYTQNDAMVCAWQIGATQENRALITDVSGDAKIELFNKWSDGHSYWGINGNGTEVSSTAPSDASGFWLMQRTGASACELHQNDTLIGTSTNASAALVNQGLGSGPAANTVACFGIGASLTSGQQTAFYNAMRAYMTAVGVP